MTTRGIRNNNPMNIRRGDAWKGCRRRQTDKEFVQFTSMKWGLRAALIVLRAYVTEHNLHTVREIINRWAPPSDGNATDIYVVKVEAAVAFAISGTPYCFLDFDMIDGYRFNQSDFKLIDGMISTPLLAMVQQMCRIESGYNVSDREVREALALM